MEKEIYQLQDVAICKHRVYGYNMSRDLVGVDFEHTIPEVSVVEDKTPTKQLFDLVFSVDPVTLLPSGDLAMFMNENTSPEVRRAIEMNLMSPMDVKGDSSGYDGMSDDLIMEYMREPSESLDTYRLRMFDKIKQDVKSRKSE